MKKLLLLVMSILIVGGQAVAEKPKRELKKGDKKGVEKELLEAKAEKVVVEEPEPVVTEECLANASLFATSYKQKDFAGAYDPWLLVYENWYFGISPQRFRSKGEKYEETVEEI